MSDLPKIGTVTTAKQKAGLGLGRWVKVYWAGEPNGPVLVTLDVPGAWSKFLCFEVSALIVSIKFCAMVK
jgi:hypothetical protein